MKKFLKKITFWGFFLLLVLNFLALGIFVIHRKANFYKPSFIAQQEPEKYDYIVLGSSTGLTTIDTKQIDAKLGISGLNISMDDTGLPTHYLMLQHFLAEGHQTNKLILAITPWDIANKKPKLGNNDYRFLPFIHKDYVYRYFKKLNKESFNALQLSYWVPVIGVGYYNAELFYPGLYALYKPGKRNRFDKKGNYSYPDSNFQPKNKKHISYKFEVNNPYVEKIRQLCNKNAIELILYQSPIYNASYKMTKHNYNLINHMDLLEKKTLFYDNIHVNAKGRKKVSAMFVRNLKSRLK